MARSNFPFLSPACLAGVFAMALLSTGLALGRNMNMVQEIQFLTSDETLQKIVRGNNLVQDFGVEDEAAAVVKLRGMLNLVEAPDGGSIDIEIHGVNFTQGFLLTQHLAEAQEGDRPNFEKIVQTLAADPDKKSLSAVLERQQAIQEQIRVNLIKALN